jgi:hypothetical protein
MEKKDSGSGWVAGFKVEDCVVSYHGLVY